ncbi:MAG: hypothetical protein IKS48_13030 [Eubacterium sp.]|nr:hypothetical protein [Eubacterium sp.]
MDKIEIWGVLGIDPTTDEEELKTAYRTQLVKVNPEDDPEGFKKLRTAYEEAVKYAAEEEKKSENGGRVTASDKPDSEKNEIDRHMDRAAEIYSSLTTRLDEEVWKEWLSAPECTELDLADDMREAFLAYTMDHYQYPHNIWALFDQTFCYTAEHASLVEMFPEEYLNYIEFRAKNDDFFEFTRLAPRSESEEKYGEILTEVKFDAAPSPSLDERYDVHVDGYLREGSNLINIIDTINRLRFDSYARRKNDEMDESEKEEIQKRLEETVGTLQSTLEYLKAYDICHPIEIAGRLRALEMTGRMDEALKYSERLAFEENETDEDYYMMSTAVYILLLNMADNEAVDEDRLKRCEEVIDYILSDRETFLMALKCKSLILMLTGKMKEASDTIIKVLDINSRDNEAVKLLKDISSAAVENYRENANAEDMSMEDKLEMAWAMFRREDAEGVLELLKQIEPDESIQYGYNSLYGRNYFNMDRFEDAYPYLLKWNEQMKKIEARKEAGEELSDKDKERLDRRSFCYYMMAACAEELKKYDESLANYELAVTTLKENYRDINELLFYEESYGKLLHQLERYPEAMKVWNDMVDLVDHCIPAYIRRQETAYEMRDAQLVIDDYYNITRDFPAYAKAYVYAAKVFMIFNQQNDVDNVLARAKEADVVSDELRMLEAKHLCKQDKDEEAEKIYLEVEKSMENEESDIEDKMSFYADISTFYMNLRNENGERNQLDKAHMYIMKGLEKYPDDKALLWRLTDIYEWKEQYGETETLYKKMMSIFPDDANVNFEYGEYLRRTDRESEAKEQYYECLKKDRGHAAVNNRLMDIYQKKYLNSENEDDYKRAVKMATNQLEIVDDDYYRIERTLLYLDGFETAKALDDAKAAVEKAPDNVYAHNAVGLALMQMDRFDEAKAEFDKAIEVDEANDTPNPYLNASKCCEVTEDFDMAIQYLNRCVEKFSTTINLLDRLALLYIKKGDVDSSLKMLDEICDIYQKKYEDTGNRWYNFQIFRTLIKGVYKAVLADDQKLIGERETLLWDFMRNKGYDVKKESVSEQDRGFMSDVYEELGSFYRNLRQYDKAAEYYSDSLSLKMIKSTEIQKTKFGFSTKKVTVERFPEEDKNNMNKDLADFYATYTFILYMCGKKKESEAIANHAMKCIIKMFGGVDNYLSFPKLRPIRLQYVANIMLGLRDSKSALAFSNKAEKCLRCDHCHYSVCIDRFLMFASYYESEGRLRDALGFYKMAWMASRDDTESYLAVKELEKKLEEG